MLISLFSLAQFRFFLIFLVHTLRQGYRSVRMRNVFGEMENCLATLLVHVKIDSKATAPQTKWEDQEIRDMLKNYADLKKMQSGKQKQKSFSQTFSQI